VDLEERLAHLPQTGDFRWLHDYGDSVLPTLHAIRRHGPGAARRGALLALVHLRGEAGLDAEDLNVLRRLIHVKAARDMPYAFDACFNSWLAVQGGDQHGIMRVLGLTGAAPATYPLGETLVCRLRPSPAAGYGSSRRTRRRNVPAGHRVPAGSGWCPRGRGPP